MPQFHSVNLGGDAIRKACDALGFGYIHPCSKIQSVLESIAQSDVLIAEPMHGAIVADALRVPWIPIETDNQDSLPFKWQRVLIVDWSRVHTRILSIVSKLVDSSQETQTALDSSPISFKGS